MYQPAGERDTVGNPRWFTPVFYRSYGAWTAHPATQAGWIPASDWKARLDRDLQWSLVFTETSQMLHSGSRTKGVAFLWYGAEGQGLDLFHQRLKTQLRELLHQDVCLLEYRPPWPEDLGTMDLSYNVYPTFTEMYCRLFKVDDVRDVQRCIREKADPHCPKKLVYVRHQVLTPRTALNLHFLQDYLAWWDLTLPQMLGPGQFGLLGISYQAGPEEDPRKFAETVGDSLDLEDLKYKHIHCRILDQLAHVDFRHLRRFIDQIAFPLPAHRRDQILREIWDRSDGGSYERIIQALEVWLHSMTGRGPQKPS